MKIVKISLLFCLIVVGMACEKENKSPCQCENGINIFDVDLEVLAYILPDSLEMPAEQQITCLGQCRIQSQALRGALLSTNVICIAKAFPDWDAADSIAYNDIGERVRKPAMHRIFTLTFASKQAADKAVEVLKDLPMVLFAEKNSNPSPDNDTETI